METRKFLTPEHDGPVAVTMKIGVLMFLRTLLPRAGGDNQKTDSSRRMCPCYDWWRRHGFLNVS